MPVEIDELFRNKLEKAIRNPRPEAWNRVAQRLPQPPAMRVRPLWVSLGVAASLLLALLSLPTNDIEGPQTLPMQAAVLKQLKSTLTTPSAHPDNNTASLSQSETAIGASTDLPALDPQSSQRRDEQANYITQAKGSRQEVLSRPVKAQLISPLERKDVVLMDSLSSSTQLAEALALLQSRPLPVSNTFQPPLVRLVLIDERLPEAPPKRSRLNRIVAQLRRLKRGERMDMNELGIHRDVIVAAVVAKFN